MSFRKSVSAIAIASAVLLGTTGCGFAHQVESLKMYTPSDGSQINLGDVKARNFVYLVGSTKNLLVGSLINSGLSDATVKISYLDASGKTVTQSFDLASDAKVDLGYNGQPGIAMDLEAAPGSMISIYLETATAGSNELLVPALNGDLAEWAEIVNSL